MAGSHKAVGVAAWTLAVPHLSLPSFNPLTIALATAAVLTGQRFRRQVTGSIVFGRRIRV